MSDYCVVVADGARARLFTLEQADIGESGPNLVEISDLANPESNAAGKEIYSEDKSGRGVSTGGGGAHGYDDHRNQHIDETERRFAKIVAAAAAGSVQQNKLGCLIVAAEPRMMGHLRDAMGPAVAGLKVKEVVKDLTKLSAYELHEHLAADNVLPAREVGLF
ncbi:host attachment protein [Pseudomonadota bacterium]